MSPRMFLAALVVSLAAVATAVAPVAPPVTISANPSSVQPGDSTTITAGMPVSDAGTVSQEITQTIDPAKAVLTGASGITAPAGWGLSFFDGSSWSNTAPANAAAWAQVTKVKTSGTINSQGSEGGYQIAAGTATGSAVSLTPASIPSSGTGDGYQAFFDPARTRVFNVYHHATGNQLDCHVISTGATCTGFPFAVGITTTGQYSTGRVVGNKVWIAAYKQGASASLDSVGFYCVNIAAVLASGGSPSLCSTSYVPLATGTDVNVGAGFTRASSPGLYEFRSIDGVSTAGSASETRIWASLASNGKLVCLDTATGAACSGMPANGWATAVKGWKLDSTTTGGYFTSMVISDGRIYVEGSSSTTNNAPVGSIIVACVLASDPSTECPGFTGGKNLGANWQIRGAAMVGNLVELPASDGSTRGVCLLGDTRTTGYYDIQQTRSASSTTAVPCWDAAGAAFTGPATLSTMVTSSFTYGFTEYQQPLRAGSRIYWGNGVNFTGDANYPPRAFCWDASAASGAGAACGGMPATGRPSDNYTVTPDPAVPDCMWITRDAQPNLRTYDMVNNVLGCTGVAPTRASFPGSTVVPRMACNGNPDAVRAWKSFTLTSPAPSATFTATLTVKDSSGAVIPGWSKVPITAGTALDLTSLSPSVTGLSPSFQVDFTVNSGSISSATARLVAVGDSPELCLQVQSVVSCPAVAAPGPIQTPANATTMPLLGEGTATDAQNQVTSFTPGSGTLNIAAPSMSQCSGALNGHAMDTSPTPRPAVGITVALYDASGNAVVYPAGDPQAGQPVTTTTDANGAYSFANLSPAGYKVRFVDSAVGTVVSSTVAAGGSGTVNASGGAVTSGASTVAAGGTGTVNAIYTLAATAPTRTATTALNTPVVFDPFAAVGASAAAEASSNANFTSTKGATRLCGPSETAPNCLQTSLITAEGTWSVSTSGVTAGQITFTPATGYLGAAPAVTYSVTDSASLQASGTLTPTVVGPPSAVADTSTGNWDTNQTINVLSNDTGAGTALVPNTVKLCPNPQPAAPYTASNCNLSTLTINGEGTYTANADGTVTFDPLPSFQGQAQTPVRYVVQDGAAQIASALVTPTVNAPSAPVATPETKAVIPGGTATFSNLITGGSALATGSGLQTGNINGPCLVDPADSVCKATFSISGEGTWTVNRTTGVATFQADPSATSGTKTPVTYRVTDAVGQTATSTLTPNIPPPPSATPDTSTGNWDTNQTINVLSNDAAGTGASLVPNTVKLCPNPQPAAPYTASNCNLSTLTINGEGTYTANADGTVTFDPLPSFRGQAQTPIRYVVQDDATQVGSALITPTVNAPATPQATPETKAVIPGGTATFSNLITGGSALATGSGLQTGNINGPCLVDPADSVCKATFSIAGEGTWTVDRTTGVATFAALGGATSGTKTAVTYRVTDAVGQAATSTLTPTIPARPSATADTSTGNWDANQTISVLSNDSADAGASLVLTTVKLCPNPQPASPYTASNCNLSTLTINGEGTYTANADGTVTFDPLPSFQGQAQTPVRYVVQDNATQVASALITPTVNPPSAPVASPETMAVIPGATATFSNLITGGGALATGSGLQTGNVNGPCLVDPSDSVCKATFSIAGEGTWTVDRATGVATFQADPAATPGSKTSVTYRVTDAVGQTTTSTLTPNIPAPPSASPDTSVGVVDANQIINPLLNDSAGSGQSLVASTVGICTTATATGTCTGTTLNIPGEGTYTVNNDGTVTFDPLPTFTGTATPIKYVVQDALGQVGASTITPQVVSIPAPVASPDTTTGLPNATQMTSPVLNDTAGDVAYPLDPTTVRLCGPFDTAPACSELTLTTSDGTYTVNPLTGSITFQPVANLLGAAAPVTYSVTDTAGQHTSTSYTPSVVGIGPPQVSPATVSVAYGTPGTMTPQVTPGTAALDPSKNCLAAPGSTCVPGQTSLTRPEGSYVLDPSTGIVTFTPAQGYSGTPSDPPLFCATDVLGQSGCATLTPTVGSPPPAPPPVTPQPPANSQGDNGQVLPGAPSPAALPEVESTMAGQPVTLRPLANDSPSSGAMLDPSSVQLRDPRTGRYADSVVIAGQGTFRVNADGTVTFTPEPGFVGTTPSVVYRVTDSLGKTTTSTVTVIVRDTPPPWADPLFGQAMRGQPVIFDPTSANTAGNSPFVPSSVRIQDPATGRWTTRVVIPGEGTWTVDTTTGKVRFTPLASFTGAATPLNYRMANSRGQKVSSTLNPMIRAKGPALSITTRASHTVLRPGQRSLITLRIANHGLATTTRTITRAPIPKGFAVVNPMGGTVRGGYITFSTGNLKPGGGTTRHFVLVATSSGVGQGNQQLIGRATSSNTRPVTDPTALQVIGSVSRKAPVTG